MNPLYWLDWRLRFKFQNLLDWTGKKFGFSRKPIIINSFIAMMVCICWNYRTSGWAGWLAVTFLAILNSMMLLVFLYLCDKKNGEAESWEIGKFYRYGTIGGLLLVSPFMLFAFAAAVGYGPAVAAYKAPQVAPSLFDLLVAVAGALAQFVFAYIPTCVEAPPKEKKESKLAAYATR